MLFLAIVAKVLVKTPFATPGTVRRMDEVATVGIVLCICIPAALLVFRFLEAPMTIWLKDWLSGRKAQSHSPSC